MLRTKNCGRTSQVDATRSRRPNLGTTKVIIEERHQIMFNYRRFKNIFFTSSVFFVKLTTNPFFSYL